MRPRTLPTLQRAAHHMWVSEFTLTSDYAVELSPLVQRAEIRKFERVSLAGQPLHQPQREVILPHPKALEWHQAASRVSRVNE